MYETGSRGLPGAILSVGLLVGLLVDPATALAGPVAPRVDAIVAAPRDRHAIAVFGKDDRRELPDDLQSLEGRIGILVDDTTQTVCTASCIGPDLILSAAHCVFHRGERSAPKLSSLWFSPSGSDPSRLARIKGGSDKLALQNVMTGTTQPRVRPPIDASSDWAVLRLAAPICAKGSLAIRPLAMPEIEKQAKGGAIFQVAYHRDLGDMKLTLTPRCEVHRRFDGLTGSQIRKDFSEPAQLLLHRCDTGEGSSGSPLLLAGEGGPEIIGLNAGVYLQSRVLLRGGRVEKSFKPKSVANTGVSAERFAALIEAFRAARPVATEDDLVRVQERLKALGFYAGTIDGLLGERMRAAIKAYQRSLGEAETGVPSLDLIERLAAAGGG